MLLHRCARGPDADPAWGSVEREMCTDSAGTRIHPSSGRPPETDIAGGQRDRNHDITSYITHKYSKTHQGVCVCVSLSHTLLTLVCKRVLCYNSLSTGGKRVLPLGSAPLARCPWGNAWAELHRGTKPRPPKRQRGQKPQRKRAVTVSSVIHAHTHHTFKLHKTSSN